MKEQVEAEFTSRFNKKPDLYVAPGRINLLGEHVDYNEGIALPTAIDKQIIFAVAPNQSETFNFYAADFKGAFSFTLNDLIPGSGWRNYVKGVVAGLHHKGLGVSGFDCVFGGNIPGGAGLSSSAALCSGLGFAINEMFDLQLTLLDVAKNGQYAEHAYAGAKVGLMDQYASLFSKANTVLQLDFKSLTHTYIPLDLKDHCLLLIDTCVKHELASTAYNARREACEKGVEVIQLFYPEVKSLRDVSLEQLQALSFQMDEEVFVRCLYIVEEISRVKLAVKFIEDGDLKAFGKLMYATHAGLSRQYEVSCEESDFLVNVASESKVTGARMMGGGFGGCTLNLVREDLLEAFKNTAGEQYFEKFGQHPAFYSVHTADGVHRIS